MQHLEKCYFAQRILPPVLVECQEHAAPDMNTENQISEFIIPLDTVVVWLNGNSVVSCFTLGPVSTSMGDCVRVQLPVMEIYLGPNNHPGQLSLAIPQWIGGISTGDGFIATTRKETASSVTVDPVTRTVGILA